MLRETYAGPNLRLKDTESSMRSNTSVNLAPLWYIFKFTPIRGRVYIATHSAMRDCVIAAVKEGVVIHVYSP